MAINPIFDYVRNRNKLGLNKVLAGDEPSISQIEAEHDALYEQYKGTEYEKYFENPYRNLNVQTSVFGFANRKAEADRLQKIAEADADALHKIGDLEYASPVQEASRQRVAGLNPDLLGVSGQMPPESAQTLGQQALSPDDIQNFQGMAGSLLNVASVLMSVPSSLTALAGDQLENAAMMEDIVSGHLGDFESLPVAEKFDGTAIGTLLQAAGVSTSRSETLAKTLFPSSKRLQKQFQSSYKANYNTLQGRFARAENLKDLLQVSADPTFDPQYRDIIQKVATIGVKCQLQKLEIIAKHQDQKGEKILANMNREVDVEASEQIARQAEANLETKIANNSDGAAIGQARTQSAKAQTLQDELAEADYKAIKEAEEVVDQFFDRSPKVLKKANDAANKVVRGRRAKSRRMRSSGSTISGKDVLNFLK